MTKKKETALKYDVFAQLVKDTKHNIIQREVFDKSLKDEVNDFCLELGETTSEFITVQYLYDSFISKGNSEAFFAKPVLWGNCAQLFEILDDFPREQQHSSPLN